MNRNQKEVYCFIYDEAKHFYRASQMPDGRWSISSNAQIYPIKHNPKNLLDCPVEFSTNSRYFSMNRSINYPLEFTFDGAAILNSKYLNGKGVNEMLFFAMFEFDTFDSTYKLSYNGRFDFQQKKRNEKTATFTVTVVDDSAWGVLSQNDDVEYTIDCSPNNPKTVKVLFDDFTLKNRYTYQTVEVPLEQPGTLGVLITYVMPFVLINQDGDSSGVVSKNQSLDSFTDGVFTTDYVTTSSNYLLQTFYGISGVNFQGSFKFTFSPPSRIFSTAKIVFRTSNNQVNIVFQEGRQLGTLLLFDHIYNISFDFNLDLAAGEKVFLFIELQDATLLSPFIVNFITTNIFISTLTKAQPTVCFGLRPLDVLKSIVSKATFSRYTIDSDFFQINNKTILMSGDSIRGVANAKIYTSFRDFFETFSALFFMALRVVNGSLFMELADEVYKQGNNLIDLGEIIELETSPAIDFYVNQMQVGSPKQDYRHQSGRLEFNGTNSFNFPFSNIKSTLSLVTKYRTDGYGAIFLILDYRGQSTQDNSGDKSVFVIDITDEKGSAAQDVETFENINVDNAPLAPIIKYPLDGDIINNNKPLLKGIGIPGTNVNIYIASVFDGGTVVDVNGNWQYQIVSALPSFNPGVFDGISVINATNTDMLGALNTIQLIIDTTVSSSTSIIYPKSDDSLYNNLPLIKGVAPAGTNININLDGVLLASVVADNSCKFEYKVTVPIPNGNHNLDIGTAVFTQFNVNSFVEFPLITYIGSELDGFIIVNNLPLIRGVAIPGTIVTLWLNFVTYAPLGSVTADINGNWEFQVVPVSYIDPVTFSNVVLAPIRNGLSVISTLLINNTVKINVSGFKLNRPLYSSITGVPDNTVINTRLSPKRMALNHKSLLSSIMNKQRNDVIKFGKEDKNSTLRTVLGSEVIAENSDIHVSSLGAPLMILEYATAKVIAKKNFADTLNDFNNGGTIKGTFKGNTIYFLPIGSMKMKSIMDDVQEWRLLISPQTSYNQLLNLYKNGLTINLMQNSIFHSDYNSLHAVEYAFPESAKYNFKEIYDDWFTNRNSAWLTNPQYIQKYQKTEILRDQIITNGVSSMTLRMYRCRDASLVTVFNYEPVSPAPIPIPEIVLEAIIDLSAFPEDQYFFVAYVSDVPVFIFERIETRVRWNRTILIESSNSVNMPGIFYSTGFKTILRVEGIVKKLQPSIDTVIAKEESGDTKMLFSNFAKKRIIRFGTAQGLPDYLYLKCAAALTNDNPSIEGVLYTLGEGELINPSEDVSGVPMYYYNVSMTLQENSKGKVFPGAPGADVSGVILVLDATAIGLPAHSIINITEE